MKRSAMERTNLPVLRVGSADVDFDQDLVRVWFGHRRAVDLHGHGLARVDACFFHLGWDVGRRHGHWTGRN